MTDELQPALTPDQWRKWSETHDLGAPIVYETDHAQFPDDYFGADRHGLAALCLHGQPFGFTQQDVELVREFGNRCIAESGSQVGAAAIQEEIDYGNRWLALANRIAALLPPPPPMETP